MSPSGGWQWTHRPDVSHAVVAVFEQASGRVSDVYTTYASVGWPCLEPAASDSTLVGRAERFLRGVGWEVYPEQHRVTHVGDDLVLVEFPGGDPYARVFFPS